MNDIVKNVVLSLIPNSSTKSPSGWLSFNCPMCMLNGEPTKDNRRRGGILINNENAVSFNCFRCGYSTGWSPGQKLSKKFIDLLKALNINEYDLKSLVKDVIFLSFKLKNNVKNKSSNIEKKVKFHEVSLPEKSKPLMTWLERSIPPKGAIKSYEYLKSRGESIANSTTFYWSPHMINRVIVPFYYDDIIVGWTARYIGNDKKTLRYNSNQQKDFVFCTKNSIKIERKYIIIVEGPFDALAIEGIALLGNTASKEQIKFIKSIKKEVIVLPDLYLSNKNLANLGISEGWSVSFPKWESNVKDAADAVNKYGRLFSLYTILKHREDDPYEIKLKIEENKGS